MALLATSFLTKDGHLLFPFLAGLPYQILSSSPVCCWISKFSATWRTFKDHTSQLWCCSSNASAGLDGAIQSHKLALTLDSALLLYLHLHFQAQCFLQSMLTGQFFISSRALRTKWDEGEREGRLNCVWSTRVFHFPHQLPLTVLANHHLSFVVLAQAVVSPCSVLLRSTFQLWAMQNFLSKCLETTEKAKESRLTKCFDSNNLIKDALGTEISYHKQKKPLKILSFK